MNDDAAVRQFVDLCHNLKHGRFDRSLDHNTVRNLIRTIVNAAVDKSLKVVAPTLKTKAPVCEDMRSIHNKLAKANFMEDLSRMLSDGELTADQFGFINLCMIESYFMGKHNA